MSHRDDRRRRDRSREAESRPRIGVDATAAETATGTVATVIESGIPDATRAHLETPEGTEADHAARVAEIIGTDVCLLMLLPVL